MKTEKKRAYSSPLREEQAHHTRESILEAAMRLLAEGASALTVPAVAREAGVAVPTVYRHFSSKEVLEEGVAEHVRTISGVTEVPAAGAGLDQQIAHFGAIVTRFGDLPEGTLALLMADTGRRIPLPDAAERLAATRAILGPDLDGVAPEDAERFVMVVTALCSSPAGTAFRRLGVEWDECVALLGWVMRTVHGSLRRT